MAFTVTTYNSRQELQDVIGGTVTRAFDEADLSGVLDNATSVYKVLATPLHFVVIDSPTLPNLFDVVQKGAKFTVIVNTP